MHPRAAGETVDYLLLGNSESISIGEPTMAIGHPEQGAFWTLTTGQIGALLEDFSGVSGKHVFQMETSVNRGNSGGPLIDGNGQMIGVNSMIARQARDGMAITGVNFAIRSRVVRDFVSRSGESLDKAVPRVDTSTLPPATTVVRTPPPPVVQQQAASSPAPRQATPTRTAPAPRRGARHRRGQL